MPGGRYRFEAEAGGYALRAERALKIPDIDHVGTTVQFPSDAPPEVFLVGGGDNRIRLTIGDDRPIEPPADSYDIVVYWGGGSTTLGEITLEEGEERPLELDVVAPSATFELDRDAIWRLKNAREEIVALTGARFSNRLQPGRYSLLVTIDGEPVVAPFDFELELGHDITKQLPSAP